MRHVGEANVAYKVTDDGAFDLLYFAGLGAHLDLAWDRRVALDFYSSVASFSRLITFDRRGPAHPMVFRATPSLPGRSGPRTCGQYWTRPVLSERRRLPFSTLGRSRSCSPPCIPTG
jgi:hypothetical protein